VRCALAARLIKIFDDGAEMAAAMYADKALAKRDLPASIRWKRIVFAVQQLQHGPPPARKAVN
jgi:hypothetical protein